MQALHTHCLWIQVRADSEASHHSERVWKCQCLHTFRFHTLSLSIVMRLQQQGNLMFS